MSICKWIFKLTWRLCLWVSFFIACCPLSVCVHLFVNFSHCHLLFQNHWTNFNQTWHKASLGEGNSRGDNNKIAKIHWENLKIFSRTTGQSSTELGTKHSWVKGTQVLQIEGHLNSQKSVNDCFLLINFMV